MSLLSVTTGECLDAWVETQASDIAIVDSHTGQMLTWSVLHERVDEVAKGLLAKGLQKGERLGIWSSNSIEWIVCFLAAAKTGIIAVSINIHFKEKELEDILQNTALNALCFSDGFRGDDFNQIIKILPETLVPGLLIGFGQQHGDGVLPLNKLIEAGRAYSVDKYHRALQSVSCSDPLVIQLTSGSTATPKRVVLTHHNITNNAFFSAQRLGVAQADSLCLVIPLFHCFGLVSGLFFSLMTGCRIIIIDNYRTEDILMAIQRYHCTVIHGVPTIFSRLVNHESLSQYNISTLKKGIIAGALCSPKLIKDIAHRLGMSGLAVSYGQTETSPCCTQTCADDSLEIKSTSIGKPLPYVEMSIINPNTGEQCVPGVEGELCTRGYHLMLGYDGEPQRTQHAIDEHGWFHSGDIGFVDSKGYFHYAWRKKDIIVRGGENISPGEVTEAILEYPSVTSACVFGVASETMGEDVAAAVCPKDYAPVNDALLIAFLRERLARYKVPSQIYFFSEFPLTACGKIDIQRVRCLVRTLNVTPTE